MAKRTSVKFKTVATDQNLEHIINRSQKSSGGIISSMRKKYFVAEWKMIYHKMNGSWQQSSSKLQWVETFLS